tara:strand:+ start:1042 stop:1248 length:207 start_codon:yes stop_codon:yes gene_type:complete
MSKTPFINEDYEKISRMLENNYYKLEEIYNLQQEYNKKPIDKLKLALSKVKRNVKTKIPTISINFDRK